VLELRPATRGIRSFPGSIAVRIAVNSRLGFYMSGAMHCIRKSRSW
jgi:hypothetical protein